MLKIMGITLLCLAVLTGCAKKEEPTATGDQGSKMESQAAPAGQMAETTAAEMTQSEPAAEPAGQMTETPTAMAMPTLPTKLGDPAYPLMGLTFVKGQPTTIVPGKVYVVEFWATWCPPCRESIPHLTALRKKYEGKGVVFVGISNEDLPTVKPFVAEMGDKMDYNVAVDTAGAVVNGYMGAFRQDGIPTAFVVNAKGQVVWYGHPMGDLDQVIGQVLAGTYKVPS